MVDVKYLLAGGLVVALGLALLVFPAGSAGTGETGSKAKIVMFKSPNCGCCVGWAEAMREAGYEVEVKAVGDMDSIKEQYGIPSSMLSCHTAIAEGYFIEGHVPPEAVDALLEERPTIDGIALPGMPAGSPGMPGVKVGAFSIFAINGSTISTYLTI